MRKRFGQSLRLGLTPYDAALVRVSRWGAARTEVLAEVALGGTGHEAIANGVRQLLADAGCAGWPVSVVLSDDLARMWQVTPPQNAARLADLEAAAGLRFQTLFGESAGQWKMAAGWDIAQPFLAAAMPRQLLELLQQAAIDNKAKLVEIVPHFIAGWNQWRGAVGSGGWYALVQHQVLTLGAVEGGQVRAIRASAVPAGASGDWLAGHVAREALRLNVPAPTRLFVSGPAPAIWNNSAATLPCVVLGSAKPGALSPAAQLAVTGISS